MPVSWDCCKGDGPVPSLSPSVGSFPLLDPSPGIAPVTSRSASGGPWSLGTPFRELCPGPDSLLFCHPV